MYYGRYSREAGRWITSWPLPSELIAHATIEPTFEIVRSSGVAPDGPTDALDDTLLNKKMAE